MAYATLNFKNQHTGAMKSAPVGFSWTTLFFGFFPALLRGHWVWVLIMVIVSLITVGWAWLVFPFIYNKAYIKYLIGDGFKVTSSSQDPEFIASKLQLALPMAEK